MARKVTTTLTCDQTHPQETEGTETIGFSFGKDAYETDACGEHADAFRARLAPFIAAARAVTLTAAPRPRTARDRVTSADMRAWCREKGYNVSDRGRIPVAYVEEYKNTH